MLYFTSFEFLACAQGKFGYKCQYECNCKDGQPCDRVSGYCRNGCAPGHAGKTCLTGICKG